MIAADLHILLHALAPIDVRESLEQPSPAAHPLHAADNGSSPNQPGLTEQATLGRDETTGARGLTPSISHIDGGSPREGVNLIRVCGETVRAIACNHGYGDYTATEEEYDLGRPCCVGRSALEALRDLQELLEEREIQRRDREFARIVRGTQL